MKNTYLKFALVCMSVAMVSCKAYKEKSEQSISESKTSISVQKPIQNHVVTAEEQSKLTATDVLADFKAGNERFRNNNLTVRDHKEQIRKSAEGQYPKAFVLSCVDSRVPVEDVFDQGIGDIFVGRVAGNFADENMLGSMEFACKVAGAKVIVVMAHQHCGAVKATIDDVKLGNITSLVDNIKPAIEMSSSFTGEKMVKNNDYVKLVAENNVKHTIENIRKKSPILKEMESKGEIKIVGVYYSLETGKLDFIQ